jgi:hypothetical protein
MPDLQVARSDSQYINLLSGWSNEATKEKLLAGGKWDQNVEISWLKISGAFLCVSEMI